MDKVFLIFKKDEPITKGVQWCKDFLDHNVSLPLIAFSIKKALEAQKNGYSVFTFPCLEEVTYFNGYLNPPMEDSSYEED